MKKLFISFALLIITVTVFSQHPIGNDSLALQTLGNSKTLIKSKGAVGSDSGFVNAVYPDTASANLGKLKNYPGAQIRVVDTIFVRNSTATKWLNISVSTGGGSGVTSVAKGWGILQDGTITTTGTITLDSVLLDERYANGDINFIVDFGVLDSLNAPPGSPSEGDKYLVGTVATGDFAGEENNIATYTGGTWAGNFQTPSSGQLLINANNGIISKWTGTAWIRVSRYKISLGGDALGVPVNIGTTDNRGLIHKTNNIARLTITNNGTYTFNNLTGTGTRITQVSSTGVFSAITDGTDGQVLTRVAGVPAWANGLSSTLTDTHIFVGNASNVATDVAASGDLTLANTGAFTFNTVNSNVGSFTNANITVDAKGRITAAANGSASSSSISALTVAAATNTIDNGTFAQEWQWNTLNASSALKLSSTSTAAASNTQTLFNIALSGANSTTTQTTYGMQVTNTHTGTSSSNVAGYFSASGGTNNYGLIVNAGFVGMGITAPTGNLHIKQDQNTVTNIIIDNQTNGTAAASQIKLLNASEATGFTIVSVPSNNATTPGAPINIINSGSQSLQLQASTAAKTVQLKSTVATFTVGTAATWVGSTATTPTFVINDGGVTGASTLLRFQTALAGDLTKKAITWFDGTSTIGSIALTHVSGKTNLIFGSLINSGYTTNNLMQLCNNGNLLLGTITDAGHTLDVKGGGNFIGGIYINTLGAVSLPSLVVVGTAGSTTITYKVIAKTAGGLTTAASSTATTTTANATLSGSNYVTITWTTVQGAFSYDVYRVSTNGSSPTTTGKITTVTNNNFLGSNSYSDQGAAGDGNAAPVTGNIASTLGVGLATTTAALHIRAGTADISGAPLKFTSGTLMATPEAGAVEFDGTHFYGTIGSTRYQLDRDGYAILGSTFAATNTVGAAGTQYVSIQASAGNFNGTEAIRSFTCPVAGTLRNFYITTSGTQSATGSFVLTVRKNGVDQTVVITIAAGAVEGNFSDVVNSFTVAAGDKISVKGVNNASVTSTIIPSVGCIITNY